MRYTLGHTIKFTLLVIAVCHGQLTSAQVDSSAIYKDSIEGAKDVPVAYIDQAIGYERSKAEPDLKTLGIYYEALGYFSYYQREETAIPSYQEALKLYLRLGETQAVLRTMENYRIVLSNLSKEDDFRIDRLQKYGTSKDTLQAFFHIDSVMRWEGDTAYVRVTAGHNHGVFLGSDGGVLSANSDTFEERENLVLGNVTVTQLNANSSVAKFYYLSDMSQWGLQVGDLIALDIETATGLEDNIVHRLSKKHILMATLGKLPYISAVDANSLFAPYLEQIYVTEMLDEVKIVARAIKNNAQYDSLLVVGGKFDGMKWQQALEKASELDIKLFLEYVYQYPFTYMGSNRAMVDHFMDWITTPTPVEYLGNAKQTMLDMMRALEYSEAAHKEHKWDFCYYIDKVFYNALGVYLDFNKPVTDEAFRDSMVQRFVWLTDSSVFDSTHSILLAWQGYRLANQEKYQESLKKFQRIIDLGFLKEQGHYGVAAVCFEMEDYQKSIDHYDSVLALSNNYLSQLSISGKGAALFRQGNWKKARPYFVKAYKQDSNNFVYQFNMGLSHLFGGDQDSVNFFLDRCMKYLTNKSDYEGLIETFDFNIEKGWYEEENLKTKDYIVKQWKEEYEMKVMSDQYWSSALDANANGEKALAQLMLDTAIWAEYRNKEVNYSDLRWYHRQKAYMYYEVEKYDSSLFHYNKALEINLGHIKDEVLLVCDYDNVGNLHSWLDQFSQERIYDQMEKAIDRKLHLDTLKPRLIYFGISTTTEEMHFQHGDRDIEKAFELLSSDENTAFSSTKLIHLKNPSKQDIQDKFIEVVGEVTEDDILILHLTGPAYVEVYQKGLILKEDSISLKKLFNNLTFIQSLQTICIADIPRVNFVQEYVAYRNNHHLSEDVTENLLILSPELVRMESRSNKHSLLMLPIFRGLSDNAVCTSKDLVNYLDAENDPRLTFSSFSSGVPIRLKLSSKVEADTVAQNLRGGLVHRLKGTENNTAMSVSQTGVDYALLFACNEYDDWGDLNNPINDAQVLQEVLISDYGYKVELVLNATKDQITQKIKEYKNKSFGPKDQLLIYFAGHGYYEEEDESAYLVCKNSVLSEEEKDKDYPSYIHYSYLYSSIGHMKSCKNIFMVMDVCFGGTFFDKFKVSADYNGIRSSEVAKVIDNKRSIQTRLFLTSGSKEYVPDGRAGANSPFSSKFIQALKEKGKDNGTGSSMVTLSDLVSYMHGLPTKVRYGSFGVHQQNGDFVFEVKSPQDQRIKIEQ